LELDDLADQGVLGVLVDGGEEVARPGELYGSMGRVSAKDFQNLRLTPTGLNLHRLMRLDTVPAGDRARLLDEMATLRQGR
jgi:hypothetical protein